MDARDDVPRTLESFFVGLVLEETVFLKTFTEVLRCALLDVRRQPVQSLGERGSESGGKNEWKQVSSFHGDSYRNWANRKSFPFLVLSSV